MNGDEEPRLTIQLVIRFIRKAGSLQCIVTIIDVIRTTWPNQTLFRRTDCWSGNSTCSLYLENLFPTHIPITTPIAALIPFSLPYSLSIYWYSMWQPWHCVYCWYCDRWQHWQAGLEPYCITDDYFALPCPFDNEQPFPRLCYCYWLVLLLTMSRRTGWRGKRVWVGGGGGVGRWEGAAMLRVCI